MATWSLRQRPDPSAALAYSIAGAALVIGAWWSAVFLWSLPKTTLPTPLDVVKAIPYVWNRNLLHHIWYSVYLNVATYAEAVLIAIPLGYMMGLFGPIRAMFERWVAAFRFAPITAFIAAFIKWFGIGDNVKIQFLVFGLLVYLLPTVIQRIDEVEAVYLDTAKTCGASRWQRITTVFWPLVSGRLSDDLRSLVAISWTYIVIAEGFNLTPGGLGAQVSIYSRASRWDCVFVIVAVVILIGFIQDRTWLRIDRWRFPWKYQ